MTATTCTVTSPTVLSTGVWLHVVASWERTGSKIACSLVVTPRGGAAVTTTGSVGAPDVAPPPGPDAPFVGRDAADDRGWRGYIDQLMLFDRPLAPIEAEGLSRVQDGVWYE